MAEQLPVQKPKEFGPSAKKILQKAAELIQRTGGHALAMYVDDQHSCNFYASKELAALATDTTATNFFCQELVQKPHQRLRPHETLLSRFTAASLKEQQLQFMADNKTRQKTWRERAGNLQALAELTARTHPDNAFLLFLEGGKDVETIQEAPAKLKGIFEDSAWVQHVLQRIQTANTSAINSNSASIAEVLHARPASRRKRTAETQDADTDEMSVQSHQRRQRRRVVPAFVMPAGTAVWYHRKLLTDPAAYCVPLTAGSWALPGYSIASNKLVAQSLVQVRCQASLVLHVHHAIAIALHLVCSASPVFA